MTLYANYKEIAESIANFWEFKGNSMSAFRSSDGCYVVKSYDTVILEVNLGSREYWLNEDNYSRTTSHHQGIIRRNLPIVSRNLVRG
jgi:hypothetical protein